jgi:hypothetical protein
VQPAWPTVRAAGAKFENLIEIVSEENQRGSQRKKRGKFWKMDPSRLKIYQRSQSAMMDRSVPSGPLELSNTDPPHQCEQWPGPMPRERRAWRRRVSPVSLSSSRTQGPTFRLHNLRTRLLDQQLSRHLESFMSSAHSISAPLATRSSQ